MILALDCDEGILKIGSPPEILPGIVESLKINDSLLMEDKEIQGRSGKVKIVQGWDDAGLQISMSLIDDPDAGKTRWDYLKQIAAAFKKITGNGKPEIYTLHHPMINAWGTKQLLFTSLESTESRTRRKVTVALEFVEYESSAGVIQDRQGAEAKAKKSTPAPAQNPPVSDQQRRGLGKLEKRYAGH
jgi:hypothetical protein